MILMIHGTVFSLTNMYASPQAQNLLPTKADLGQKGILQGWLMPWEFNQFQSGPYRYEAKYNSAGAYFAADELKKMLANKQALYEQIRQIPDEDFEELKKSQAELSKRMKESNLKPSVLFPSPLDKIGLDMIDQIQTGSFTKEAWAALYKKYLDPILDGAGLEIATVELPPQNEPHEYGRAGKVSIKIYLYDPLFVRDNISEFRDRLRDRIHFEAKYSDFYKNLESLLFKNKGIELENELEYHQSLPASSLSESLLKKIEDLFDGLEAIDLMLQHPHEIDSQEMDIGDNCLSVRAVYTYPERERAKLLKASGDVGSQYSAYIRQGSAVAHVSYETNGNHLMTEKEWESLLQLIADKMTPYKFR